MAKKCRNAKLVKQWLDDNGWRYCEELQDGGEVLFIMSCGAASKVIDGYGIMIDCLNHCVQSMYLSPLKAPRKARPSVLEFMARVNRLYRLGKFTMDVDEGDIRWEIIKTTAELEVDLDKSMGELVLFSRLVMDDFAPGIFEVVAGNKTAKQAFVDCRTMEEGQVEPESIEDAPTAVQLDLPFDNNDIKSMPASAKETPLIKKSGGCGKQNSPCYGLEGLNIQGKMPLAKIIGAVRKFLSAKCEDVDAPRVNILLTGVPGSGKTAFAKHLAKEVGLPMRTVRASELLSKYVGETERKLAEAFAETKTNGEILFLDEIDSFLQDRAESDHGWQVSMVNELLQQMELFGGVMIGATNFAEHLDKAVLRRFTYKLSLDYLTDEGKGIFFERYFKTPLTEEEQTRLNAIAKLTPGDFRTVREELFYLSDKQTNEERLDALEAESEAKGRDCGKIGF